MVSGISGLTWISWFRLLRSVGINLAPRTLAWDRPEQHESANGLAERPMTVWYNDARHGLEPWRPGRQITIFPTEKGRCRYMIGHAWMQASSTTSTRSGFGGIRSVLNEGLLPEGYYALAEQHAGRAIADVLTLHAGPAAGEPPEALPEWPPATGGTAVAEAASPRAPQTDGRTGRAALGGGRSPFAMSAAIAWLPCIESRADCQSALRGNFRNVWVKSPPTKARRSQGRVTSNCVFPVTPLSTSVTQTVYWPAGLVEGQGQLDFGEATRHQNHRAVRR